MASEITITTGLAVTNGNLKYFQQTTPYQVTQTTQNGPSPGAILATTGGVTVSFSALTLQGVCSITNTDATNYVTYGLYISSTFYPLGELQAGENYVFRFSRTMLTANAGAAVFRLVANTASVRVVLNCFDA